MKAFPANTASISALVEYIARELKESGVNPKLSQEYQLLVEEIAIKMAECARDDEIITVKIFRKLGGVNILLRCPGKPISLQQESEDDPGGKIIEGFSDYLRQSYKAGVNEIMFSSSTTESNHFLLMAALSTALALITSVLLDAFFGQRELQWLNESIVYPMVGLFTHCLQTLATPVAFFSLASFLVTLRLTIERDNRLIRICVRNFIISLVALCLGVIVWQFYRQLDISLGIADYLTEAENFMGNSIGSFLEQSVTDNIISPFQISNPVPMLILGVLLGLAAGIIFGTEGEMARHGLASLNGVFCKMMDIVYGVIPFFMYFALLWGWIQNGFFYYLNLLKNLLLYLPAVALLLVVYIIQLALGGVNPFRFLREYKDVLWENLKIGSNINALPYNKRMIHRKTKMPLDMMEVGLELGGLMNMDGNCVMVSMWIAGLIFSANLQLSLPKSIMLIIVSILLSVGAPNQPGSLLLSAVVLMSLVGISPNLYGDLLVVEAVYGKVYSCLNAVGDIVGVVIENAYLEREAKTIKSKS